MKRKAILFLTLFASALPMFAEEVIVVAEAAPAHSPVDFLWMMIAGFMVFFMQACTCLNKCRVVVSIIVDFSMQHYTIFNLLWKMVNFVPLYMIGNKIP